MFIKLSVISLLVHCVVGHVSKPEWELAVVMGNKIELLQSNGTAIKSLSQPFSSLRALAYDSAREQFIVSDRDMANDTIYTVQLKETDTTAPIIQGLPGDVQGLAVDPIDDILYWTDAVNRTINSVSLVSNSHISEKRFAFEEKQPHAITVDVCKRFIYWTTNHNKKPTIERARLDRTDHQILVNTSLLSPEGITIDYKAQKLYWADSCNGVMAGKIESINLDGSDRRVVVERTTMQPFGVAVDEHAIFWTDTNNRALYKLLKHSDPGAEPEKLREFEDMPMGLVAFNDIIKEEPDCNMLEKVIKEYEKEELKYDFGNRGPTVPEDQKQNECLNDGVMVGNYCKCKRGFKGDHCEISICYNYCMQGNCYLSSMGKPQCHCGKGYTGDRCQINKCDGFCLNGGDCISYMSNPTAICNCPDGFVGDRCEIGTEMCNIYCDSSFNGIILEKYEKVCRCSDGISALHQNHSAALLVSSESQYIFDNMRQPVFYLGVILIFSVVVIICLIIYIRRIQTRRPRIKKRIIVNKSVTPLTYRPQPTTEQCEITIENCCNMNVCETPCFEPREDKKKLLHNMENEDLY